MSVLRQLLTGATTRRPATGVARSPRGRAARGGMTGGMSPAGRGTRSQDEAIGRGVRGLLRRFR